MLKHLRPVKVTSSCANLRHQKQVARTEQEILNRIKEKEIHVTQLKKKLEGVKVRRLVLSSVFHLNHRDH